MSYTSPLGNAVNFDQTGTAYSPVSGHAVIFGSAYHVPVGNVADLNFGSGYSVPAGNAANLKFGSGGTSATGWLATSFGDPLGFRNELASGFSTTQFGATGAYWDQLGVSAGWRATTFAIGYGVNLSDYEGVNPTRYYPPFGNKLDICFPEYDATVPASLDAKFFVAQHPTGFASTTFGVTEAISSPNWVVQTPGFVATQFGSPYAKFDQFGAPSGWQTPAFPSPRLVTVTSASSIPQSLVFGQGSNLPTSLGFATTVFGAPTNLQTTFASGFQAGSFGTPRGYESWFVFGFNTLKWASPYTGYTPVNQTGEAHGFLPTWFGTPLKPITATVVVNLFCAASQINTTAFGTPVAQANQTAGASGSIGTNYGTTTLCLTQTASGATSTQLGVPMASARTRPLGFRATTFGQPTQRRTQTASSTYHATRWGVPSAERSRTYKAYRINTPTRFGRPKGYSRFNYPATAIHTTQLGTHTSFETHHAWRIEPTTHFGQPLLKRTPLC